jgi:hypothetical protein
MYHSSIFSSKDVQYPMVILLLIFLFQLSNVLKILKFSDFKQQ